MCKKSLSAIYENNRHNKLYLYELTLKNENFTMDLAIFDAFDSSRDGNNKPSVDMPTYPVGIFIDLMNLIIDNI